MLKRKISLKVAVLLGLVFPMFGTGAGTARADAAPKTYSWSSLNVRDLKWDDEAGLWQNYGAGAREGEKDRPVVHNSRFSTGGLFLAARFGLLDDPRAEKILRALQGMQSRQSGQVRGFLEDSKVKDSNYTFFMCRMLLLIRNNYSDQLTPESKRLLDEILKTSYTWFYKAAMENTPYYPNAYMGDLFCAKLIQDIFPRPEEEVAALDRRIMKSIHYWKEHNWGWGEHLSDTYAAVCMDLLSQYLLCSEKTDGPVYSECKNLLAELLLIEDSYGEGPRVPAIRSYSFNSRGGRRNYRERIDPWNTEDIQTNPYWRESDLITAAFYDAGWHRLIEPPRNQPAHNVSIPCFGGIVATAIIEDDIRLGSLSRFPVMPDAENIAWGLAWQSFPIALWTPKGDWGFLQWETVEEGQVKAHPASVNIGARALTSSVNPPVFGETYSIQRGGDLLVVRIMPVIVQSWERVSDVFKIADCTAAVTEAQSDSSFNQLLLEFPDRTVSVCNFSSLPGLKPVLETEGNTFRWRLDYSESELKKHATMKIIVDVWGISLNGEITEAPTLEVESNHLIPLVDAQQKRRLVWQWPNTQWDVTIDPMSENPLQSNE